MSQINALIAKRASAAKAMEDLHARTFAEGRDLTSEERVEWDRIEEVLQQAEGDIRRINDFTARAAAFHEPSAAEREAGADVTHRSAFASFLRYGMGEGMSADERELLGRITREQRAQGTAPNAAGGYTIAPEFWDRMAERRKAFGGLQALVNTISTGTGAPLPWPTLDSTNFKAQIIGEKETISLSDLTFAQRSIGAYTYRAAAGASLELLQDSAFDIEGLLAGKIGESFYRGLAEHVAVGTGTGQPLGIATSATVGRTGSTGQISSVTYDDIVMLEHSVDPAYRANAQYAFNDLSLMMLRLLKDADGRPLWQPSLTAGAPDMFNGKPYTIDNDLPTPGAGKKSILFGDFKAGYVLRNVMNPLIVRAAERYIEQGIVAFFGFARFDGQPDDPYAIRAYAHPSA